MKIGCAGFLAGCLLLASYVLRENNRFIVVEQEVAVQSLPAEFDGFKILQITDLHEKEFGSGQRKLIEAINQTDYDAIVFTGDMLDESTNYSFFYTLIEGIENKKHALYIKGNADPENYETNTKKPFGKHEFIRGMEARGVFLLDSVYTLNRAGEAIHFVDFELTVQANIQKQINMIDGRSIPEEADYKNHLDAYFEYQKKRWQAVSFLGTVPDETVLLALTHYPVVDQHIDYLRETNEFVFRPLDLIIAGHYHGGQIRLPFIGALFVPEAWYERSGFFPPQDRVKGLWEYAGTKQYVSAGLGSSDAVPLLQFRFLNPPEINVLTLKQEKEQTACRACAVSNVLTQPVKGKINCKQ